MFTNMLNIKYLITKKDLFPSVLGVTYYHFFKIVPKFFQALRLKEQSRIPMEKRQRKPGGGRKSNLGDDVGKLFFILFYYRHYPTLRLAQVLFELEDSNLCYWVHFLSKVLFETLGYQLDLPLVKVNSIRGLYEICPDLRNFIVDGTEREIERPKDKIKQKDYYSGKSKQHAVKNQLIINPKSRKILHVTNSIPAHTHDKKALTDDGILLRAPPRSKGLGDSGFQGITKDCSWLTVTTPIKRKPRQELSEADKFTNKVLSSIRVRVEHVIGRVKINKILKDPFRGSLKFADLVFKNACSLYNFRLSYRYVKRKR